MNLRHVLFPVLTAAVLAVAAACSKETIVLASYDPDPEEDAGMSDTRVVQVCTKLEDCDNNEFCQLDKVVSSVPSGHCKHRPIFCRDSTVDPVCGSNGITYVSDCYRKQAGVSSMTEGECPSERALSCSLFPKFIGCPVGATCELLGGGKPGTSSCGPPAGHCWGLTEPCEDDGDGPRWDECSTEPGALRCVSSCTAIQSGKPFARVFNCVTQADAGPKP